MIVVDASALVEWLLRTSAGLRVAHRVITSGNTLHAPEIVYIEVTSACRRAVIAGTLRPDRAEEALRDLAGLRLRTYPHLPLIERVWELRNKLSAYHASYVALAEVLAAPIVTCDQKLGSAHGHHARIETV